MDTFPLGTAKNTDNLNAPPELYCLFALIAEIAINFDFITFIIFQKNILELSVNQFPNHFFLSQTGL